MLCYGVGPPPVTETEVLFAKFDIRFGFAEVHLMGNDTSHFQVGPTGISRKGSEHRDAAPSPQSVGVTLSGNGYLQDSLGWQGARKNNCMTISFRTTL